MPDTAARVVVRNRRRQPVELHLPGRVVVIAPQGECELDGALAATPQLAWLVARKALYLQPVAPAAPAAPAPRARKPKAAKKAAAKPKRKTP